MRAITEFAVRAAAVAMASVLAACSNGGPGSRRHSHTSSPVSASRCRSGHQQARVTGPPGFSVCLFVAARVSVNQPDSVLATTSKVFIGWQNGTAKNGTDHKTSTIGEYTFGGALVRSWRVLGHVDGLRINAANGQLWVLCNEEANPRLFTINLPGGAPKEWALPKTPHGGGFDDIQFVNGSAYIDASNPRLNALHGNVFPALYRVRLLGGSARLTPVLMGDAEATTYRSPSSRVYLNLVGPDSMMIDPSTGHLMLDNQPGQQMLFISGVGSNRQAVKVARIGDIVDDVAFSTTSKGCLLVSDTYGSVYTICSSHWVRGTAYVAAPVLGIVGRVNFSNGVITAIVRGLVNPHGMTFIPHTNPEVSELIGKVPT
jgi:hypothetical protein